MAVKKQEPDKFQQEFHSDIHTKNQGKLKIFLGYAEGTGKTYAMLQAAYQVKKQGVDVVAGYIETHNSPQIESLLEGVEQLKPKQISFEDKKTFEFDIDAALKRNPDLILIDEYAHTNLDNSRHIKRYQDVQELLNAGINVYTTVNIQHIESLNDVVSAITGVSVKERIPDSVFDKADQVELVDIEPTELLERMKGKSALTENQNSSDFFTLEKLTALREIALRRCADRVNLITENARLQSKSDYHTDEHILVCVFLHLRLMRRSFEPQREWHRHFMEHLRHFLPRRRIRHLWQSKIKFSFRKISGWHNNWVHPLKQAMGMK